MSGDDRCDACSIFYGADRQCEYAESHPKTYNLSAESQTQKIVDALDRLTDAVTKLAQKVTT
ncbi:MAG: hypothetical protein IPK60_22785 [Sandaracinaceae bacterium]|nr:hypothetical protein [Sandaracinaceae bacterium]